MILQKRGFTPYFLDLYSILTYYGIYIYLTKYVFYKATGGFVMTRTLTAFTLEIDDIETAVSEILEQLALSENLLKNSVGIISCYSEFINTGVVRELCRVLPFDVVGTTTIACGVNGEFSETMLSLMVITSDETEFVAGITEAISSDDESILRNGYESAAVKFSDKPKFMISFAPLLMNIGAEFYIDAMDNITGGIPNYGTLAVDHHADYHEAQVIYNGEAFSDRYAMVLVGGDISPVFMVAGISNENVFPEKGVVTAAIANQLQTVNNISVVDYLHSLGLEKDGEGGIIGINSFPFVVDYNDGSKPIVRVMFALTPDGSAVCGGNMPIGATLSVGKIDSGEVLATTKRLLKDVLEKNNVSTMLMFSCVGRYFAQGFNQTAEMQLVGDVLDDTEVTYQLIYSGGELCPVYDRDEKAVNRNHNDTFIICAF